jgi:hypothetical protein
MSTFERQLLKCKNAGDLAKIIRKYKIFPFFKLFCTGEQAVNAFNNLLTIDYDWNHSDFSSQVHGVQVNDVRIDGVYYLFDSINRSYSNSDWLVDYFTDESRMRASRKGYPSPFEAYFSDTKYLSKVFAKFKTGVKDLKGLRDAIYSAKSVVPECGHESASFIKSIIKVFQTDNFKIFDACAGWGDRMLAAYACGVQKYLGVDPNTNTQPGFNDMKHFCEEVLGREMDIKVVPEYMPDFTPECNDFDLSFISPPSYDSEIYSDDPGQSTNMFSNKTAWTHMFLIPTIQKISSVTKVGGHLIVQSIIIDEIFEHVIANGFRYKGVFGAKFPSRVKPLWCFERTS